MSFAFEFAECADLQNNMQKFAGRTFRRNFRPISATFVAPLDRVGTGASTGLQGSKPARGRSGGTGENVPGGSGYGEFGHHRNR